jgi:hypothetical protein
MVAQYMVAAFANIFEGDLMANIAGVLKSFNKNGIG